MKAPILSIKDRSTLSEFASNLPHALLIAAEQGLDGIGAADELANSEDSDVFYIKPAEKKQIIAVEQVRSLIASLRTYADKRRVIIINDANLMSEAAQNALLKALEEPNKNTHFILVAENPKLLLDTIRSRCQLLQLHKTSPSQDAKLLSQHNLDASAKQQILFLAAGRPLLINQLANSPRKFAEYKEIAVDAKQLLAAKNNYQALKPLAKYFTDRQKALLLTDIIVNMIRFQIHSRGIDAAISSKLAAAETAAKSLKANGNVRLALLQLVIY